MIMEPLSFSELRDLSTNLISQLGKRGLSAFEGSEWTPESLLERLLQTAEHPAPYSSHRAAACNTLAGFLDQGSSNPEVQALCLDSIVWSRAILVFLQRHGSCTPKPMRHLLTTLIKLLDRQSNDISRIVVEDTVGRCLLYIFDLEHMACAKPAMLAIEALLNKGIVTPHRILEFVDGSRSKRTDGAYTFDRQIVPEETFPSFFYDVLKWAHTPDIVPAATRLLVTFCKFYEASKSLTEITDNSPPIWVSFLQQTIEEDEGLFDILERHVVPDLLRIDSSRLTGLLHSLPFDKLQRGDVDSVSENDIRFCLLIFKSAGGFYMPLVPEAPVASSHHGLGYVSFQNVALNLLSHASSSVRILALSALLESRSSSDTLPNYVFDVLLLYLPAFHSESDAKARTDFVNILKKLVTRLSLVINRETKSVSIINSPHEFNVQHGGPLDQHNVQDISNSHRDFLSEYLSFILAELRPTASYQCHITALKVFHLLASSSLSKQLDLYTAEAMEALLHLIVDPFDDVRATATNILRYFSCKQLSAGICVDIDAHPVKDSLLSRAEDVMCRSGRPDFADGVGRLYDLLFEASSGADRGSNNYDNPAAISHRLLEDLERDVQIAIQSISSAVATAPIHGRLIALRYLASRKDFLDAFEGGDRSQSWRNFYSRLQTTWESIWRVVRPILCIDSPEGHVIMDEEVFDIGAKDTLSYSWRTLKETSSLMETIVTKCDEWCLSAQPCLYYEDFKAIGESSLMQLAELRHRGAFSTVSQTFASCCIRCAKSENLLIAELPKIWYQETLKCIHEQASALTRRSAGLPAMITGLLAAYPTGPFFDNTIRELQNTAKLAIGDVADIKKRRLPQVHALNCLKDIFISTKLASGTDPHLADTISIAVHCLENELWAIRNCGIMLFKALLLRLAGGTPLASMGSSQRRRHFSSLPYDKCPNLSKTIIKLLERSCMLSEQISQNNNGSRQIEVGFSAMEIIDRIGVMPDDHQLITGLLSRQLESQIWYIREKAARTMSFLTSATESLRVIKTILGQDMVSVNALHGNMICLKYLCDDEGWEIPDTFQSTLDALLDVFDEIMVKQPCPFIRATYLETFQILVNSCLKMVNRSAVAFKSYPRKFMAKDSRTINCLKRFEEKLSALDVRSRHWDKEHAMVETIIGLKVQLSLLCESESQSHQLIERMLCDSEPLTCSHEIIAGFKALVGCSTEWHRPRLSNFANFLADTVQNTDIQCAARIVAMDCFSSAAEMGYNMKGDGRPPDTLIQSLKSLLLAFQTNPNRCSDNPDAAASELKCQGACLSLLYQFEDSSNLELKTALNQWSALLRFALDEKSDWSIRLAAVSSIWYFRRVLRPEFSADAYTSANLLKIYVTTYDALSDDDEEVREAAALTVSWILSRPGSPDENSKIMLSLKPVAAGSLLLEFLASRFKNSSSLSLIALRHILEGPLGYFRSNDDIVGSDEIYMEEKVWLRESADTTFHRAVKDNNSLFVEEKQNLYVDEVQEAEKWARLLSQLSSNAVRPRIIREASCWLVEGLDVMLELARNLRGGLLGWSSKAEVFTIGMRVLLMAELVLGWSRTGHGKLDEEKIKVSLLALKDTAKENPFHVQWRLKLQAILSSEQG